MESLSDVLANVIKKEDDMQQSLTVQGGLPSWFMFLNESISSHDNAVFKVRNINDTTILIWNHPTQGKWDNFKWAGGSHSAFGDPEVLAVINKNNTFIETINNDDFIDTSTATVNYVTHKVFFVGNQVFQSKIIAKNDVAYSTVNVSYTGDLSNCTCEVSFDGVNYNTVQFDTPTGFSNINKEGITIRISSTGSVSDYFERLNVSYS